MVIPPPQPTSFPVNPVVTQTTFGGTRLPFLPIFTLTLGGKGYPYGIPTKMIKGLQTNMSMYVSNAMVVVSPFNPYLESKSIINSPGRMGQSLGGLGYILRVMPPLTKNSLLGVMQQMDDTNHDMVNMLTPTYWHNVQSFDPKYQS